MLHWTHLSAAEWADAFLAVLPGSQQSHGAGPADVRQKLSA